MKPKKVSTSLTLPTVAGPSDWHARQEKAANEAAAMSRSSSVRKGKRPSPPTAPNSVKRQRTQSSSVKSRSPYPSASPSFSQHPYKRQRHASPFKISISPTRPSPGYRSSSSPDPLQMMPAPRKKAVVIEPSPSTRMAISSLVGPSKARMSLGESSQSKSRVSTPRSTRPSPRQQASSTKPNGISTPYDVISISDDEEDEPPPRRASPVKNRVVRRTDKERERSELSETPSPRRHVDLTPALDPELLEKSPPRQTQIEDVTSREEHGGRRPQQHFTLSPDFPPADPITEPSPIRAKASSGIQTRTPATRPPRRSARSSGGKPTLHSESETSDHQVVTSSSRSLRNRVIHLDSSPSPPSSRQSSPARETGPSPARTFSAVKRKRMLLEVAIPKVATPPDVVTPRITRGRRSQPTSQTAQSPKVASAPRVTRAKAAQVGPASPPGTSSPNVRVEVKDQEQIVAVQETPGTAASVDDASSDVFIDALVEHVSSPPTAVTGAEATSTVPTALHQDATEDVVMKSPTHTSPEPPLETTVSGSVEGEKAVLEEPGVLGEVAAKAETADVAKEPVKLTFAKSLPSVDVEKEVAPSILESGSAQDDTLSDSAEQIVVVVAPSKVAAVPTTEAPNETDDVSAVVDPPLPSETAVDVQPPEAAPVLPAAALETVDPQSSLWLDVDSMQPDTAQVSETYVPPTEPTDELAEMLQYVHEDAYVEDGSKPNGSSLPSPLSPMSKLIKARDEANAQFALQAQQAAAGSSKTLTATQAPHLAKPAIEPGQATAVSPSEHAQPIVAALEAAVARAQAVQPVKSEKRARRSNAGTTANAREVEKMVADWLERMNEPEDGAPATLPIHLTTLDHSQVLPHEPMLPNVDTKPAATGSETSRIETPGWSLVKPGDDEEEDRLAGAGESPSKMRHRSAVEESTEDTSDERYAAAHKRYESFERRQRIREKEKLQFERHLMRTKLDILKGMPPNSWSAIVNGALQRSDEAGAKPSGAGEQLIRDNGVDWLKSRLIAEGQEVIERYDQLLPVESRHKKTQGAPYTLSLAGTPPPVLPPRVNALREPRPQSSKKVKQSSPAAKEIVARPTPPRKSARAPASPSPVQSIRAASVVSDGDPPTADEIMAARAKASLKQRAALAAARQVEEDPFIPITTASGLPCLVEAANRRHAAMEEHEAAKASGKTVGPQRSSSRAAQIMPFGAAPPAILGWKMNYDLDGQLWWDMLEERRIKREEREKQHEAE